jgi:hypothetical protein
VHGVSLRDGASGSDRAVKAKLDLTGLPTGLDLNSPAGTTTEHRHAGRRRGSRSTPPER